MKRKRAYKKMFIWFTIFLSLILIGTNEPAKAEEEEEVKLKGDCYYRYEDHREGGGEAGIKIVGIRRGVQNPHIPDEINGEKVLWIQWNSKLENVEKNINTLKIPRYVEDYNVRIRPIKVKNYKVHSKNENYCTKFGCLYSKDGEILIAYPDARKEKTFKIPKGTVEIGDHAFIKSQVEKVLMPNSVKYIGYSAFRKSKLKNIKLSLKLEGIEREAFEKTNIRNIVFPKSLKQIGASAFARCKKLKTVIIPKKNQLYGIGQWAFSGCNQLREFIYPEPVLDEGHYAYVEYGAFEWCKRLKKVEFPVGLRMIGLYCFSGCMKLKEVTIKGDTRIGYWAFDECKSLQKVILKGSGEICGGAFQTCGKLKEIRITSKSKKGYIDEEAFVKEGEKKKLTIIAPKDSYAYNYAKEHKKQGIKAKALK